MIFFKGFVDLSKYLTPLEYVEAYYWIEHRMLDWSILILFSKSFDWIIYDTNVVGLMKQIWVRLSVKLPGHFFTFLLATDF